MVEIGEHALDRWGGCMAGKHEVRLSDLNEAYRDPDVRAVIATRGGAGAYRIAEDIDFAAVRIRSPCRWVPSPYWTRTREHSPSNRR